MLLPLDNEGIYSVSLDEGCRTSTRSRSITATMKGGEINLYKEEFSTTGGAVSTLLTKYSTTNRFTAMLKAFSEFDFPAVEDSISEGKKDDYYILSDSADRQDDNYWCLDFKSPKKSLYVKGNTEHECYKEIQGILNEFFPQFAEIHREFRELES